MNLVALGMNLLLAALLFAALTMGWRLNRRLKALRDSHDGFAIAVHELNVAATRAEQGLADLRAATDEATDTLADRIENGRALAAKLERLTELAATALPPPRAARAVEAESLPERMSDREIQRQRERQAELVVESRLGALLSAARDARPERLIRRDAMPMSRLRAALEEDLFNDQPPSRDAAHGARR